MFIMKSITQSLHFRKLRTLDIVVLGVLLAVGLVLNQLTFGTQFIQFGFGFAVMALTSAWYGPWWSAAIAMIADIIGTLLTGGGYFPGFTLSAILSAIIYGLFLYQHQATWTRVILSQLIISTIVSTILNTWWLNIMYKTPFMALLSTRIIKEIITTPIQIIVLYIVLNAPVIKKIYKQITN